MKERREWWGEGPCSLSSKWPRQEACQGPPPTERSNQENHMCICIMFAFDLLLIYINPLAWAHLGEYVPPILERASLVSAPLKAPLLAYLVHLIHGSGVASQGSSLPGWPVPCMRTHGYDRAPGEVAGEGRCHQSPRATSSHFP